MPGLFGIAGVEQEEVISDLIGQMISVTKYDPLSKTDLFVEPPVGLARIDLRLFDSIPQPVFNEDKSLALFMDGEIYDFPVSRQELISGGHKLMSDHDPELVLHMYEDKGESVFPKLNGSFIVILWDKKTNKLTLVNDRYGSRPFYYTSVEERLIFGSEIKTILKDSSITVKLNNAAVADFFSSGIILGEKTFFAGIDLLPAASIATYQDGQFSISRYWDFNFNEDYSSRSDSDYVEEFWVLLKQAVERQLNKPYRKKAFFLSGGLDTRSVVASVERKPFPIQTCTFGAKGCDDEVLAKKVSSIIGSHHRFYELSSSYISDYAGQMVKMTEGNINIIWLHGFDILPKLSSEFNVVMGGLLGGEFFGQYQIHPTIYSQAQNNDEFIKLLFDNRQAPIKKNEWVNLFSGDFYDQTKTFPWESFTATIQKANNFSWPNITDYYNFSQTIRRFNIHSVAVCRNWFEYHIPFYDYELVDFALRVPPALRFFERLRREAIKQRFPKIAHIPWAATGLPLDASRSYIAVYERWKRAVSIIDQSIRKISGNRISLIKKPPYLADHNKWLREDSAPFVKDILLDSRTLKRPFFNPEYIRKTVLEHMEKKSDNAEMIGALLTFEIWCRIFLD